MYFIRHKADDELLGPKHVAVKITKHIFMLTVFRRVRKFAKAPVIFLMSVRLSVCMEQRGCHCTDFHEILYLSIFRKSGYKISIFITI